MIAILLKEGMMKTQVGIRVTPMIENDERRKMVPVGKKQAIRMLTEIGKTDTDLAMRSLAALRFTFITFYVTFVYLVVWFEMRLNWILNID